MNKISIINKLTFILLFVFLSFNSKAQYRIPTDYDEVERYADLWCRKYFNQCFSGRKYDKIFRITASDQMHDEYGDYQFVQGKIFYYNYLDLPQSVIFQMKIYGNKTIFSKQSISITNGRFEWESCSKLRGY